MRYHLLLNSFGKIPIGGRKTEKPIERFFILGLEIQTKNKPRISDLKFLGLDLEIFSV